MKKASCISFASSFGRVRDVRINRKKKNKQRRRGYFQVTSILNAKPANTSNRRHRAIRRNLRNVNNNEPTEQPKEEYTRPELRYEVLYPSSITSSITHNPKYIDPTYGDAGTSSRRTKQRKARGKLVEVIQEDLDILGDDFDDSEEEDQTLGPAPPERETRVTLEEILQHADKAKSLVMFSGKQANKDINKKRNDSGHIVYLRGNELEMQRQDSEPKSENTSQTADVSTALEPVTVVVSAEDVDEWMLKHQFGDRVLECECFPRKFIIDISDDVSSLDSLKYFDKSKADTTFACIVFTHDVTNEINNEKESVYKVYLNMPFSDRIRTIRIETLFDYMATSVDEIVQKSIFFVETLTDGAIVKDKKRYDMSKRSSTTTLENCAKWESASYRLDNKHLIDKCFPKRCRQNENRDAKDLGYEVVSEMDAFTAEPSDVSSPEGKFCSVCFESIDGPFPATALMSCCHWFCDACWREHLVTGIREGRTVLVCPEYDCDREVDLGTLLTLAGAGHVVRFLRRCHDTEVEQQSVTKWCPNPACGAVLKVPSNKVKTVTCQCGRKMCFDCLREMHWPAPCKAASDYKKKLVENGDDKLMPFDEIETIEIKGKPCPNCNRFVEKNGGCPYMYCACRQAFCWGCGKEWNSVQHGPDCYKHGYSNTYQTTLETINPDDYLNDKLRGRKNGKRWYKIALEHRLQQHQVKFQKLRKPMKELTSKLQHYVGRSEWKNELVSFEFDEPGKQYPCEAAKTKDFLKNMLDLYTELHQIAEHVAVYEETVKPGKDSTLPVKHITNRMTALSVFIYDLLQNGTNLEPKHVFTKLKDIRFHARKCITGLVRCINRIES